MSEIIGMDPVATNSCVAVLEGAAKMPVAVSRVPVVERLG